jgi:hypothetical protein
MQYPFTSEVMEPNVFSGQPMKGIVSVLCSFENEHYPSNSIDPLCLITQYPNEGIHCLLLTQYPSTCQKICYGTQCISRIPREG